LRPTASLMTPQPGAMLHEVFFERAANATSERGPHALATLAAVADPRDRHASVRERCVVRVPGRLGEAS